MNLIDRYALLKNVYDNPPEKARMTHAEWCRKCIYEAPKVEAEPLRHGRWIVRGQDIYCSECNEESLYNPFGASKFSRFCPNCGARMDLRTPTEAALDMADSVMMGGADNG